MSTVTRQKISNIIYNRLDNIISKAIIYDAIGVICEDLSDKLANNEAININNFGMIDAYTYHGHKGINIASGKMQYVKPFKMIKFVSHTNLIKLLDKKRSFFEK